MRAILPKQQTSNAMQPNNKETTDTRHLVAVKGKEVVDLITVRWYMGRSNQASVVYCCVWIHGSGQRYYSGKGQAGGWGYHKYSAAFASALTSAGIELVGSPYHGPERFITSSSYNRETGEYIKETVKQDFKKRCHIGGCGDNSIDDAMKAMALALGYKKFSIIRG